MSFMREIPTGVFNTFQDYTPSENGFGVRLEQVYGNNDKLVTNWDTAKSIDAVIKTADYVFPQIGAIFKAIIAAVLLAADAYAPLKEIEADGQGAKDVSNHSVKEDGPPVFQLKPGQKAYLKAQVVRGVVAATVGPLGLLLADTVATLYSVENSYLLEKFNELKYTPDFLKFHTRSSQDRW